MAAKKPDKPVEAEKPEPKVPDVAIDLPTGARSRR